MLSPIHFRVADSLRVLCCSESQGDRANQRVGCHAVLQGGEGASKQEKLLD